MRKPGVFDPWRQTELPPLDETPARKTPTEFPAADDSMPQHCIQFNGIRAGLFIWLTDTGDGDSARARQTLVDLVHRIYLKDGVAKIFQSWGIFTGTPKLPNPIVLGEREKKVTISVDVDNDRTVGRAIDNLSLALREIAQHLPEVRDILVALRVRPYIK